MSQNFITKPKLSEGETLDFSRQRGSRLGTLGKAKMTNRKLRHTGTGRGRLRLFKHMRSQGEQVETLRESGKTSRHLTQEEGQVT